MKKIDCKIIIHKLNSLHLNQIIAGFIELEKENIIKIDKVVLNDSDYDYLEVIINNNVMALYDTMDSGQIFVPNLNWNKIDYYFKRSYNYEIVKDVSDKIYPLGLNYDVHSRKKNFQGINYNLRDLIKRIIGQGKNKFYLDEFEYRNNSPNEKICFLTRFWDPDDMEVEDKKAKEERKKINDFRASCIRACKDKYGNQFIGGVPFSEFANKYYKDCIINDNKITKRSNYLMTIKDYDICIATTGLHNSIGWKFAEYIAMGKVIISEPLNYIVPGDLKEGDNYITFESVEELIECIDSVRLNSVKRKNIQKNNIEYYNNYLRADRLIWNTINIMINE